MTAIQQLASSTLHYIAVCRSLLRVPTYLLLLVYLAIGSVAGAMYGNGDSAIWHTAWRTAEQALAAIIIALWYINGTALNDYADYDIDIINLKDDKDRPLITGAATRRDLLAVSVITGVCALALSTLLSWQHALLLLVLLALNISYSIKPMHISHRGALAPVLLPLGYIVLPFMLGHLLYSAAFNRTDYLLIAGLYLHFIGRIILKDYRDVKGDRMHGKLTFLLRHGNQQVCIVAASAIIASFIAFIAIPGIGIYRYCLVVFTAFCVTILYKLSGTHTWRLQKPLLASYGRAMTGNTVAVIIGLVSSTWNPYRAGDAAIALLIMGTYLWSATEAYGYNLAAQSMRSH